MVKVIESSNFYYRGDYVTQVRFAVVGVRNFAADHIKTIEKLEQEGNARLTAVVARRRDSAPEMVARLEAKGVRIFPSLRQLAKEGRDLVDIITLPTSISTHADLATKCMRSGFDVVLEKPPVPTIDQMDQLIKVEQETGRFCAVGFQFIYSRSIRKLKEMIVRGDLGKIKELACKAYWPRFRSYYDRNPWAGELIKDGEIILDGPMHNALAHFLNNMLYLATPIAGASGKLESVRAELYRGHTFINSDDTSCFAGITNEGVKIYFYTTHCSPTSQDPYLEIVGTKGRAYWNFDETTRVELDSGTEFTFDNEGVDPWLEVMRSAAQVKLGKMSQPDATLTNSRSFVVAINGAFLSARKIQPIPLQYVREYYNKQGEFQTEVKDIVPIMDQAFAERKLISELNVPWAKRTDSIDVSDLKEFNPFS